MKRDEVNKQPDSPADTGERDALGRFRPGNATSRLGGRPTRARELEVFEAAARGAPAEDLERIVRRLVGLALEGDVSAARLVCQVRGLIGREEPPTAVEGESYAHLLARPGAVEKIDRLLAAVFEEDAAARAGSPPAA